MKQLILFSLLFVFGLSNAQIQEASYEKGNILVRITETSNIEKVVKAIDQSKPDWNIQLLAEVSKHMNIWQIGFSSSISNDLVIREFMSQADVLVAQNNHIIKFRTNPSDSLFSSQWQYVNTGQSGGLVGADMDADSAWTLSTGGVTSQGDTIVVCVIDGGFDTTHTDFGNNLWVNRAEIPDNNIDDDLNGYVDDYKGWNVYSFPPDDNIHDNIWHGTPVGGIIAAKGNNGKGVSGVNWDVKLMFVVGGGGPGSNEAYALASYSYPLEQRKLYNQTNGTEGAYVVATNASWGTDFGQPSQAPLWCAMYDTLGAYGILNCGATINGNYDVDVIGDLPTACPSDYMIAVTNMDHFDMKVTQAGYGDTTIDIGSYGEGAYTVKQGDSYGGFGGTSGATPHVAGAIALAYSYACETMINFGKSHPDSLATIMKSILMNRAEDNLSLSGITVSGGKLNLHQYLIGVDEFCNPNIGIEEFSKKYTLYPNPSDTYLRIISEGSIERVRVYNDLGQLFELPFDKSTKEVSTAALPSGMYFIQIVDTNGDEDWQRFMKT